MKRIFTMLLHYILVFLVKAERIIRKQKIIIVNKDKLDCVNEISGPIIFAPTHCGKYDVQVLTEVLWKHRWSLLSGDPHDLPGTVEGYWLKFNGVVYVDRNDREWRKKAKQEMLDLLNKGENLMLYPEGTWNFSPSLPVLPLFRGIADLAMATNATIVPLGLEIDDATNRYFVLIGEPIRSTAEPLKTLEILRDQLASLKWSLREELSHCKAKYDKTSLQNDWEGYIEKRLSECSYMDFALIWKYVRKEKWETEQEKIQVDLKNIRPTKQTAFLLNKRLR